MLWSVEERSNSLTELKGHPSKVLGLALQPCRYFLRLKAGLNLTRRVSSFRVTRLVERARGVGGGASRRRPDRG